MPAAAFEIEGLPGATWGNVSRENNGLNSANGMGWINQGIDWLKLPGDVVLNTYVEYRYRGRSKEKDYYNTYGPAVGIELKKSYFTLGAEYYREKFPDLPDTSHNRRLYGTWYYDWNVKSESIKNALGVQGLPGSTWGQLSRDTDGLTGSGGMGWINQGIDWFTLPGNIVFNTYAEYRYRSRSKEKEYYNTHGPAVGLEFRKGGIKLGASYYRERYHTLKETYHTKQLYLTWYYNWDLKK